MKSESKNTILYGKNGFVAQKCGPKKAASAVNPRAKEPHKAVPRGVSLVKQTDHIDNNTKRYWYQNGN